MLYHDKLSMFLIAITFAVTIYLATYQTTTIIIFPAILLLTGLVMETRFEKKREVDESSFTRKDASSTIYYTIIALCGMLAVGYAISMTQYLQSISELATTFDAVAYSLLVGCAEEVFFRGFILDFLLTTTMFSSFKFLKIGFPYPNLIVSAIIFAIYHLARYGTQINALIYVFAGGFILSWVTYKSRRLGPAMGSHMLNNFLATIGGVF